MSRFGTSLKEHDRGTEKDVTLKECSCYTGINACPLESLIFREENLAVLQTIASHVTPFKKDVMCHTWINHQLLQKDIKGVSKFDSKEREVHVSKAVTRQPQKNRECFPKMTGKIEICFSSNVF